MVGTHEMLAAVFGPFYRTAYNARRCRNKIIFRVEFAARAEAAADVDLDEIYRLNGQSKLSSKCAPVVPSCLGRAPNRQFSGNRIPFSDKTTRLHEHGGVALDLERLSTDVICGFESFV